MRALTGLTKKIGTCLASSSSDLVIIEQHESAVRYYCRGTPVVFSHSKGSEIFDESGKRYIDFLCGAGSLNYGHNDPYIKKAVVQYLEEDGILQTLDFATSAKATFLRKFNDIILTPRNLTYKVQFTGPTGTNAVEAAIKLARKYTGRRNIVAFTNAYHGVSLGALALTGNRRKRAAAGVSLGDVIRLPYDGYFGSTAEAVQLARKLFLDPGSGFEAPAAFILETVQGEGGLNCASSDWLNEIAKLARELDSLLIVDDIQAGCGRTGTFFSFEPHNFAPDLVCISKSISGIGLPMAVVLVNPGIDVWEPGEHNGTFRGNNLAFVAASAALDYWADERFAVTVQDRSAFAYASLQDIVRSRLGDLAQVKGRGLFLGLSF